MCCRLIVCGDGELNAISNAIGYAKFFSRSHDAVIRIYDQAGNVIDTHEPASDFKEGCIHVCARKRGRQK